MEGRARRARPAHFAKLFRPTAAHKNPMPRRASASNPASSPHPHTHFAMLEPTLAPHEGLPGVDGTSRFCYGVVSAAGGGGTTKPGALAAAIHKAEQAAVASAGGAGVGVAKASGGLPVRPAITPAALYAEVDLAYQLGFAPEHLRVAVNDEFTDWDRPLQSGDTVAFLPPMSGG